MAEIYLVNCSIKKQLNQAIGSVTETIARSGQEGETNSVDEAEATIASLLSLITTQGIKIFTSMGK